MDTTPCGNGGVIYRSNFMHAITQATGLCDLLDSTVSTFIVKLESL